MIAVGRNAPCPCGSGRKYKQCCLYKEASQSRRSGAKTAAEALRAGQAQHQSGRLLQAGAFYRQALEAAPDHPDALHLLGVLELQAGDHGAAAGLISQATRVRPDFAEAHANLGYAFTLLRRFDEAVTSLRRTLSINPHHKLAANNLGNALLALDRTDEAIAAYRQAVRLDPGYAEAHFNLGAALRDWGSLDLAAESMRAALRLRPDLVEAHYTLALLCWESGELHAAAANFRSALRIRPKYPEALFQLHCVMLDLEGTDAALQCLREAVELNPQDAGFRFFLGLLLAYGGDAAASQAHFTVVSRGSALDRARLAGWEYLKSVPERPAMVGSPVRAFEIGLKAAPASGLVLEFGVRMGASIRQIAALAKQPVHGFDSFQGIPENWHGEPRGSYSTEGVLPPVPDNVSLHAGWFDETLPGFLSRHHEPVRFVNVDCDLYSSTRTVLSLLKDRIVPGSVILFDEYLGYEHWREDEFRAFHEALDQYGWRYRYLCFSFATKQVAVQITA
jgi:tetratricopeptide (TPR) repeat protein